MNTHYPEAFTDFLQQNQGEQPDIPEIAEIARTFNQQDWQLWLCSRLQGNDVLWTPCYRMGEEPDYLFRDLIPQLQKSLPENECLPLQETITRAVNGCLEEIFLHQHNWNDYSIQRLIIIIRLLELDETLEQLAKLIEASPPISNFQPQSFRYFADDPFYQLLATLAYLGKTDQNWSKLAEFNPEYYVPLCFYGSWQQQQYDEIIKLLSNPKLPWESQHTHDHLVEALMNIFEQYSFSNSYWRRLMVLVSKLPKFKDIFEQALSWNESGNGWYSSILISSLVIGTIHDIVIRLPKTELSKRPDLNTLSNVSTFGIYQQQTTSIQHL